MIYLVDDNDELRVALEEFIATLGYDVRSYAAAEDALAALESHRTSIRLLITDVVLPGQDGFSLARHMRRKIPELSVIVISGNLPRASEAAGHACGDIEILQKPVPLRALAKKIAGCQTLQTQV